MAQITFKGNPIHTVGAPPEVGSQIDDFSLVNGSLADVSLESYGDKVKLLNIFPSIDTGICARSVATFHQRIKALEGVVVLNISADLPFAQSRFCGAEGIENAETLSVFRSNLGDTLGLTMSDGPMKGLLARAVLILDANNQVIYQELVPEIAQDPDYDAALAALP